MPDRHSGGVAQIVVASQQSACSFLEYVVVDDTIRMFCRLVF
jgi:hypothetical protein